MRTTLFVCLVRSPIALLFDWFSFSLFYKLLSVFITAKAELKKNTITLWTIWNAVSHLNLLGKNVLFRRVLITPCLQHNSFRSKTVLTLIDSLRHFFFVGWAKLVCAGYLRTFLHSIYKLTNQFIISTALIQTAKFTRKNIWKNA